MERASLKHREIEEILQNLAQAKVIDLNISVAEVMKSVAEVVKKQPEDGPETQLHIVCCNEYGLVTR